MKTPALFALALSAAGAIACDNTARGVERDAADAEEQTEARATEAEAEVNQDIREFRRESKAMLTAMDEKLRRLERSLATASAEGKAEAQEELQALRLERNELARKLDAAEARTQAEWNETERDIDRRLAELSKDINRALDHVGDETEEALE